MVFSLENSQKFQNLGFFRPKDDFFRKKIPASFQRRSTGLNYFSNAFQKEFSSKTSQNFQKLQFFGKKMGF